jgi:SAM-dependent methyltransferase
MTEHWPQHEHVYRYTMFKQLGSLHGKFVLDVPCGEGRFAEQILRDGAAGVLCCDIAPKMCALTEARLRRSGLVGRPMLLSNPGASPESLGVADRFRTVVGDMTAPLSFPGPLCDSVCASFLFEYSANVAQLQQTARNLFAAAAPGAPLCVIYVPGAKAKADIAVVKEIMGIVATELTPDLMPGDPVVVQYFPDLQPDKSRRAQPFSYTIHYWPVEQVAASLTLAGFVDVEVQRLQLNPAYVNTRGFDLARFVQHTGNRCLVGRKP